MCRWDVDVWMSETASGFSILVGRRKIGSIFKKNGLGVYSDRTAFNSGWHGVRLHTWPKSHAFLDALIHLYAVLMVIANGMSSVFIPGRATGRSRLLGRRGVISSASGGLLGMESLETDGIFPGLRGFRTYPYALRASRSTVEWIWGTR